MARPLRIEFPGAWYHVMNRGLGRRLIFQTNHERQMFLDLLGETSRIFKIEIHAYSLMDNHYHLLVHTPVGGLGRAMRHINGLYTQKRNKLNNTDGPLFRGRYKAQLVDSENYLTQLVRYIHLNPVEAKICKQAGHHAWSSHCAYLDAKKSPEWLVTGEILKRFGASDKKARESLDQFVSAAVPEDVLKDIEKERVMLGASGFKDWVRNNVLGKAKPEIPMEDQQANLGISPKKVLGMVAHAYDVSIGDLRSSQRGVENQARNMATHLLRQTAGLSHKNIARWLKYPSEYAVASCDKRFRHQLVKDKKLLALSKELGRSTMYQVKT